ncbi:flavodoxin domain-containing protein [Bacillus fonticola]|uniref:flavodoxin domain-containing protein n=1 Tax=Bacillus fonticola TaxID=2728853 RepID=UPI0014744B75|nr:flavodoxin domain-containing protein [Bacillus fonticola]
MKIAIVYASITGNTEAVATGLWRAFRKEGIAPDLISVENFESASLPYFDAIIMGTYTWGSGNIPHAMSDLYQYMSGSPRPNLVTGVFGTGDTSYPHFCGAVDEWTKLLSYETNLAVTMKIELYPQQQDEKKYSLFVQSILDRVKAQNLHMPVHK